MTAQPGSAGTAADGFRVDPPTGRHRAPPPVPTPRAPTVIAVAAAVLTAASLVAIAAAAVAPDASAAGVHGLSVSTVTRAERTDAGPLVLPTVGVVAPAIESLYPTTENALNRPVPSRSVRTSTESIPTSEARRSESVAIAAPSDATDPTPAPTVTTPPADAPPPTTAAATSSATTTEEQPVTTPTEAPVTVDVTAEVGAP